MKRLAAPLAASAALVAAALAAAAALATAAAPAMATTTAATAPPLRFFQSPSGNIACLIDATSARCDIGNHDWRAPRKPASCELDFGFAFGVGRNSRRGILLCAGDTARDPRAPKLKYGHTIHAGTLHCTSRTDGMRCANRRGHGFLLGRQAYRLF